MLTLSGHIRNVNITHLACFCKDDNFCILKSVQALQYHVGTSYRPNESLVDTFYAIASCL
jgi:hypothetical protein